MPISAALPQARRVLLHAETETANGKKLRCPDCPLPRSDPENSFNIAERFATMPE
jgi:hypothetical protein